MAGASFSPERVVEAGAMTLVPHQTLLVPHQSNCPTHHPHFLVVGHSFLLAFSEDVGDVGSQWSKKNPSTLLEMT